jgi:phage gpG-like protein
VIRFAVTVDKVLAKFAELGPGTPAVMRALDAFARVLRTRIQLGFRNSKAPSGAAWKPLNTFFRQGQPLLNTRRLYSSISARRDGDGVVVGTNLRTPDGRHSLGAIHQFGAVVTPTAGPGATFRGRLLGPIPTAAKGFVFLRRAVIPARPFMPMDGAGRALLPPAWARSALDSMGRALELNR